MCGGLEAQESVPSEKCPSSLRNFHSLISSYLSLLFVDVASLLPRIQFRRGDHRVSIFGKYNILLNMLLFITDSLVCKLTDLLSRNLSTVI